MGKQVKIQICSRSQARDFTSDVSWALIQIGDEVGDWPKVSKVKQFRCLQMAFQDIEFHPSEWDIEYKFAKNLFNEDHADEILDFVGYLPPKVELLMIHCYAGYSRSPAVAAAISKVYLENHRHEDYFETEKYHPNPLVYNAIMETAKERDLLN